MSVTQNSYFNTTYHLAFFSCTERKKKQINEKPTTHHSTFLIVLPFPFLTTFFKMCIEHIVYYKRHIYIYMHRKKKKTMGRNTPLLTNLSTEHTHTYSLTLALMVKKSLLKEHRREL